jgi:purine catabolism regulator
MGEVANDRGGNRAELPAAGRIVRQGIPLADALALPGLGKGTVTGAGEGLGTDEGPLVGGVSRREALDGDIAGHLVLWPAEAGPTSGDLAALRERGAVAVATWAVASPGDLPVVTLPADVTPEAVAHEVLQALVDHHDALLEREEAVHRLLKENVLADRSVDELCHQLVGYVPGVVMVTTGDGRVLAEAGSEEALATVHALPCFDRTGRLRVEQEPVGVRRAGADRSRAMVRIVAGTLDHGRLVAFSEDRALGADDVHLLERAATVAALSITKGQAVAAVEGKYRAEFLRDALAGRAGSHRDAVAHAESLGWDIDRALVVVVAETDEDDGVTTRPREEVRMLQQRFARAWAGAVGARDPRAAVSSFSQEVVALVQAERDTAATVKTVQAMVHTVRGDGGGGRRTFSTGVSRPAGSVDELPRAYAEARRALTVSRQMHGENAFAHFDGLGVFRLLSLIPDSADLDAFVDETLGELANDDRPGNAEVRRTLTLLLDNNMNVAETARAMFFHYNTLRYRITKLEQMLGPFTTDPQVRLNIALALRVLQLRGR